MTAKEKAEELIEKFSKVKDLDGWYKITHFEAKECALIAVDELINADPRHPNNADWDECGGTHKYYYEAEREEANKFWNEVKTEIQKL